MRSNTVRPRGLRREFAAARLLRLWVPILLGAWMSVSCGCWVLYSRGLWNELLTCPEESYRLWCVVVCDLETSRMGKTWPSLGRSTTGETNTVRPKCMFTLHDDDVPWYRMMMMMMFHDAGWRWCVMMPDADVSCYVMMPDDDYDVSWCRMMMCHDAGYSSRLPTPRNNVLPPFQVRNTYRWLKIQDCQQDKPKILLHLRFPDISSLCTCTSLSTINPHQLRGVEFAYVRPFRQTKPIFLNTFPSHQL